RHVTNTFVTTWMFSEEENNESIQSSGDNLLFKPGGTGVFSQREGRRVEQENLRDIQSAGRGSGWRCFAGWHLCIQAYGFGIQPSHRSDFQRGSNTHLCDCPRDTELSFTGDRQNGNDVRGKGGRRTASYQVVVLSGR